MIPLMAAALYGLAGYKNNENRKRQEARDDLEDQRRARIDQIAQERFDRDKAGWEKADRYEEGLAAAGAPVVAEQVDDVFNDGSGMTAAPAFRAGGQRFETMEQAKAAAAAANTPEAINARQAAFMQARGKPLEAINMRNALLDKEGKQQGLTIARERLARDKQGWEEADKLKQALIDAGAQRTEVQGTATQGRIGGVMQTTLNRNPEEAQRVKAMMDAEAEMTGAAPATQRQASAVTGNMALGHQIGQSVGAMGADPNSTEAAAQRTAQAYRNAGQVDKAISMENAVMEQQAKRLGMSIDQLKFADMQTNRALESALKSGPTWYEGAAKFVTDTKRGGLDGVSVEPVVSADGKTVTLRAKMPDGTTRDSGTYSTDESGMLQFSRQFAALPIEKRMDMMIDQLRQNRTQSNWQQTFDFNQWVAENAEAYRTRMVDLQESQNIQSQANWQETFNFNKKMGEQKAKNAGAGGAGAASGRVSMDAIDRTLQPLFTREDPASGAKALDTQAMMTVRALALGTPAAKEGDAMGAALQAHSIYAAALKNAGGDHAKAVAMIQQALKPPAAPPQGPQGSAPPAQEPTNRSGNAAPAAKNKPTPYVPPEGSPAAKAAARREELRVQSMQRIQAVSDAADAAIKSGDPVAADAVRGTPEFMSLPREKKEQIRKVIFGR
jgi:hypothetical protein